MNQRRFATAPGGLYRWSAVSYLDACDGDRDRETVAVVHQLGLCLSYLWRGVTVDNASTLRRLVGLYQVWTTQTGRDKGAVLAFDIVKPVLAMRSVDREWIDRVVGCCRLDVGDGAAAVALVLGAHVDAMSWAATPALADSVAVARTVYAEWCTRRAGEQHPQ